MTEATHTINTTESLAVATGYYLQPMDTCPIGVKVQLQGMGGVLVYGHYDGRNKFWRAWAPLPREAP